MKIPRAVLIKVHFQLFNITNKMYNSVFDNKVVCVVYCLVAGMKNHGHCFAGIDF